MIQRDGFTVLTRQKGKEYNNRKITNNSNHIIFYNNSYIGEVKSKSDAEKFIDNLVKYQCLQYTQE